MCKLPKFKEIHEKNARYKGFIEQIITLLTPIIRAADLSYVNFEKEKFFLWCIRLRLEWLVNPQVHILMKKLAKDDKAFFLHL
jgi:hypothetical protein